MTFSRRPGARFNRGRIATVAGSGGGYVAPAYPSFLATTGGAFYWAEDITDPAVWTPRFDSIGAGNMTGVNTTLEAAGWAQPEGASKSMRIASASSAYLRNDNLAAMLNADDAPVVFSLGYQSVSINANNTLLGWSNSASSTPKRYLRTIGSGNYLWTQQSTTVTSGIYGISTLQQMLVMRQINNGAGTTTDFTRNLEADPSGSLTANVAAQTCDRFLIGALWNGVSGPGLFADIRMKWFLILPSGTTLTTAQEVELHNWVLGAYNTAPLYSGSEEYLLILQGGQSNSGPQGIATGAVVGMPDASAKTWWRNINNDADNPVAMRALDRRPGAGGYSSYPQFMPTGSFQVPHHFCGVGEGATLIGNWLNTSNTLQGLYATTKHSEMRRALLTSVGRFGGAPIIIFDWNQGENDAAAGPVTAAGYQANLTTLEVNIRNWVNLAWGTSTFAFHDLQLSDAQTGGGIDPTDLNTIQAGVVAWAGGAANRYESNTDSVTQLLGDSLHFNQAGNAARAAIVIAKFKAIDARL